MKLIIIGGSVGKCINMRKWIVIEKWNESCENPIILKKGDRVSLDWLVQEADAEWANWVWCTSTTQMTGWVPIQILKVLTNNAGNTQEAIVTEDYSAYELSVERGDILLGDRILNGWLWCRKKNLEQEGWVPLRNMVIY